MNASQQTREQVSKAYARAVSTPSASCCQTEQKGVAVQCAGYEDQDLSELPSDAVVNSFGCGNPLAFGRVVEGDVVLDLGCGAGIDLLIAGEKVGAKGRVIGIDMTDEMLARARANISASGYANVEVRKGIIEDLPVESGTVDWVISNCVINLSPEKERVFSEIARVLKPGGHMLVSDIVAEEMPESIRNNESLYHSCIAGAVSESDYAAGLRSAGLVEIEVRQRIVYESSQLESLVESDLPEEIKGSACGCGCDAESLKDVSRALAGKVWSAQFVARKAVNRSAL